MGQVGGQHGGWHVGWEAHSVGGQHILGSLGRRQVGEWRGWPARWLGMREGCGWGEGVLFTCLEPCNITTVFLWKH